MELADHELLSLLERVKDPSCPAKKFDNNINDLVYSTYLWHEPRFRTQWLKAQRAGLIDTILYWLDQPVGVENGKVAWTLGLCLLSRSFYGWIVHASPKDPAYQKGARRFLSLLKSRWPEYNARDGHVNASYLLHLFRALSKGAHTLNDQDELDRLREARFREIAIDYWFNDRHASTFYPSAAMSCMDLINGLSHSDESWMVKWTESFSVEQGYLRLKTLLRDATLYRSPHISRTFQLFTLIRHIKEGLEKKLRSEAFHDQVLDFLWERVKERPDADASMIEDIDRGIKFALDFHPARGPSMYAHSTENAKTIEKFHVIDLFAKLCYQFCFVPEKKELGALLESQAIMISDFIKRHRDIVNSCLAPIWTETLGYMKDFDAPLDAPDNSVKIWTSFLNKCGLEADVIREQMGCSWAQCIFHGGFRQGAMSRTMFLDKGCGQAQYCGTYCQKRDWYDGKHKARCRDGRS